MFAAVVGAAIGVFYTCRLAPTAGGVFGPLAAAEEERMASWQATRHCGGTVNGSLVLQNVTLTGSVT